MALAISDVSLRARRRIAIRLLPFVLLMYVVCYVDRINVAFANLRMSADLGFADRVYALGVGMFFVGYVVFEIPGAVIVERWSARKWIARIMISWGMMTILTGFIHTSRQFYLARFLVGIAEASFFPGIIVYLTHWFRGSDRAKAIGFFYIGNPGAAVVGSLVAGWLLGVRWFGIAGWRWLFILEGIPPIVLGVVALFYLTDWPSQARWLPADERDWITKELEREKKEKKGVRDYSIWQAFRDPQVILLILTWLSALAAFLSASYWLPTFIKRMTHLPDTKVALLVSLPGLAGILAMVLNGWHSDRSGERRWHAVVPLVGAGICFLLVRPGGQFAISMTLFTLGLALYYAFLPVMWTMPTLILCESAAAACFGLINSVGQIGGGAGPYIVSYLNEKTGSLTGSFLFIATGYLLAGGILAFIRIREAARATGLSMLERQSAEQT
jgi:MFS transporter, ACS family, tartrate transporter